MSGRALLLVGLLWLLAAGLGIFWLTPATTVTVSRSYPGWRNHWNVWREQTRRPGEVVVLSVRFRKPVPVSLR